jgi:hypothetical protein
MKTFCNTFPLPNGVFIFCIDGRQFVLCYYEQKLKSSACTCKTRCNQIVEHLLRGTISDTAFLTYNVGNFSDPMWNLWWTK